MSDAYNTWDSLNDDQFDLVDKEVRDDYYDPAEKLFEAFVAAEYELEKIYTVTEGQDSNWKQGTTTGLLFRIVREGFILPQFLIRLSLKSICNKNRIHYSKTLSGPARP